jgi:DNA polymerase elongation subunit (family B)
MIFEGQWKIDWDWYERVQDPVTKEIKFRQIRTKPEYYVETPNGDYTSFLGGKPLSKKVGRPPKGITPYTIIRENVVNIRDNYWAEDEENTGYQMNPRMWFLDIETTALTDGIDVVNTPEELVLVQIFDTETNKMIVLGTRDWKCVSEYCPEKTKEEGFETVYKNCKTEVNLFNTFFKLLQKMKPLMVFGWNTNGFDYPFMFNRAKKLGLDTNNFSPFKKETTLRTVEGIMTSYELQAPGIYYMDYVDLYKKYVFGVKPSLALDYVSQAELGKGKVNHDMYSTFDGMRTGESYIFPENEPEDEFDLKMYNLQKQYKENPTPELKEQIRDLANDLFCYYGAIDTYRVKEIDDKLRLSQTLLMVASKMGVLISDSMGTTKPWASYIENYAYLNKQILPPDVKSDSNEKVKGGLVTDPRRGKHKWVFSIDINSAYPNLGMRGFNLSPETYVFPKDVPEDLQSIINKHFNNENEFERFDLYRSGEIFPEYTSLLEKYNLSGSVSGGVYKKDFKGIIPTLVEKIYTDRKEQKRKMLEYQQKAADATGKEKERFKYLSQQYKTAQLVSKVLINALYGGLANKYFKLFNIEIARSITSQTRFYILLLNHRIDEALQKIYPSEESYIVYNDTDSVYVSIDPLIDALVQKGKIPNDSQKITDWIDNFVKKKIDPVVESVNDEFAKAFNAFDKDVIKAEREVISDVSVFANKKQYFMRVIDDEGVRYKDDLYLKFTGIELAKSTIPPFFKKKLRESVDIILDKDINELKEWVKGVKSEVLSLPLSEISKTTGIGSLDYDLEKDKFKDGRKVAIPINSRAGLATNKVIEKNNDYKHRFNKINVGDKVKVLPLQLPNPIGQPVFAFVDPLFAEEFRDYVDYDTVFEKNFLAPLKIMIDAIGDWGQKIDQKTEELDEW